VPAAAAASGKSPSTHDASGKPRDLYTWTEPKIPPQSFKPQQGWGYGGRRHFTRKSKKSTKRSKSVKRSFRTTSRRK
jgi:hypothetical protein